jgi:hypothetical protein
VPNYTAHRTGDYVGDPTKRARGRITRVSIGVWLAEWAPTLSLIDALGTDHALVYLDGNLQSDRTNKRSFTFSSESLPKVCVIYVPDFADFDGLYDPIGSNPLAENCFILPLPMPLTSTLSPGNSSSLAIGRASSLGRGNRSSLLIGAGIR